MKKMNIYSLYSIAMLVIAALLIAGCEKNKGYYDYTQPESVKEFKGTIYDYLKSKPGVYDSMLLVVNRLGLDSVLKSNNKTVFAVTNPSFRLAITNLTNLRSKGNKPPLFLGQIDQNVLDTLIKKYIIKGLYPSDSLLQQDGALFNSVSGAVMHGKLLHSNSSGNTTGGASYIDFDDTKGSQFVKDWATSVTTSQDIKTSNGLVHILSPNHIFGFDEFVSMVTYIPKKLTPYIADTLRIPGTINPAYYDLGGEGVAYHDSDASQRGGSFRSAEGVDVESNSGEVYDLGYTSSGEWTIYTVKVEETGTYNVEMRVASDNGQNGSGRFLLEFDGDNIFGETIQVPATGGWASFISLSREAHLTAGVHTMKSTIKTAGFNLGRIIFTKK